MNVRQTMNEIAYILVGVGFVLAGISSILKRRVEHRLNGRVTAYYLFMVGAGLVWIVYAVAFPEHIQVTEVVAGAFIVLGAALTLLALFSLFRVIRRGTGGRA